MTLSETITAVVDDAIARRVFPGAVVLVARDAELLHHAPYGTTMYDDLASQPVQLDTLFDIASLTKMFTATAALRLYETGMLDIHAPVAHYLPAFRHPAITIWHLLTHTSGLDIRLSVLRETGRDGVIAGVYGAELKHPPGTQVAYTNVNSLLLGEIVARLFGAELATAIQALVCTPLGLRETLFLPPSDWLPRIAPTEFDHAWRARLVHGSVHDESTHAMGGVAGHAGMFSTATELWQFCRAWLSGHDAPSLLQAETLRAATRNNTPGLNAACGLGWMLDRPMFMGHAPPGTFGHTGFTGPMMLVEPSSQLIVVVLSNRVYPQRGLSLHHPVSAAIVDASLRFAATV